MDSQTFDRDATLFEISPTEVLAAVGSVLPELSVQPVGELFEGGEFSTWRVGSDAVVKFAPNAKARNPLAREVAALALIRPNVDVKVPICLYAPEDLSRGIDFAVFSWLSGTPLETTELGPTGPARQQLIEFVEQLHETDVASVGRQFFGQEDRGTPAEAFAEAARWGDALRHLPQPLLLIVDEFLSQRLSFPELPDRQAVLSHADLKGEHVLLDDQSSVSGIIDWADTCFVHPVDDYVGLAISMGLTAVSEEMRGRTDEELIPAVAHYARCLAVRHVGRRLAGGDNAPLELLMRQLERAFEPLSDSSQGTS